MVLELPLLIIRAKRGGEFLTPLILLIFKERKLRSSVGGAKALNRKTMRSRFQSRRWHTQKTKQNKTISTPLGVNFKVEPGKAKTKNQKQNNFNFQNFSKLFKTFQLKIWTQSHTEQKNVSSKLKISFLNTPYRLQCFALIPANTLNLPK